MRRTVNNSTLYFCAVSFINVTRRLRRRGDNMCVQKVEKDCSRARFSPMYHHHHRCCSSSSHDAHSLIIHMRQLPTNVQGASCDAVVDLTLLGRPSPRDVSERHDEVCSFFFLLRTTTMRPKGVKRYIDGSSSSIDRSLVHFVRFFSARLLLPRPSVPLHEAALEGI